jgi:hypothetical protein
MTIPTTSPDTDRPTADTAPADTAPVTVAPAPAVDHAAAVIAAITAAAESDAATLADAITAAYRTTDRATRSTVAASIDAAAAVAAHRTDTAVVAAWSEFVTADDHVDPWADVIVDIVHTYAATMDLLSTVDAVDRDRVVADALAMFDAGTADADIVGRIVMAARPLVITATRSRSASAHVTRDYRTVIGRTFYAPGRNRGVTVTVDAADASGTPGIYTVRDAAGNVTGTYASPTAAASAVAGCSTDGPAYWRAVDGGGKDTAMGVVTAV